MEEEGKLVQIVKTKRRSISDTIKRRNRKDQGKEPVSIRTSTMSGKAAETNWSNEKSEEKDRGSSVTTTPCPCSMSLFPLLVLSWPPPSSCLTTTMTMRELQQCGSHFIVIVATAPSLLSHHLCHLALTLPLPALALLVLDLCDPEQLDIL